MKVQWNLLAEIRGSGNANDSNREIHQVDENILIGFPEIEYTNL